ncbi:hypothetical protein [Fusibacter bizertensis]
MNIDQIMVIGIVIVIVMSIFVSLIDYTIPILKKLEFDSACRNYMLLAESQNGLENVDIDALNQNLLELGFDEITITAQKQNTVLRGDLYAIKIEASYNQKKILSIFKRVDSKLGFMFEQNYLARKIVM